MKGQMEEKEKPMKMCVGEGGGSQGATRNGQGLPFGGGGVFQGGVKLGGKGDCVGQDVEDENRHAAC